MNPALAALARGHHQRLARRYSAFAWAMDEITASKCGLVVT